MASPPTPAKLTFAVPGVSCANCQSAITEEVDQVPGVTGVHVDLETRLVTVTGASLDESAISEAIEAAGYDVER